MKYPEKTNVYRKKCKCPVVKVMKGNGELRLTKDFLQDNGNVKNKNGLKRW